MEMSFKVKETISENLKVFRLAIILYLKINSNYFPVMFVLKCQDVTDLALLKMV